MTNLGYIGIGIGIVLFVGGYFLGEIVGKEFEQDLEEEYQDYSETDFDGSEYERFDDIEDEWFDDTEDDEIEQEIF